MIKRLKNMISPELSQEENSNEVYNFQWARKILFAITPVWLIYYCVEFFLRINRPQTLYFNKHWFGDLFAAEKPPLWLFTFVVIFGSIVSLTYFSRSSFIQRLICLFSVLWVNSVIWTTGHSAHVAHVLIYLHLFTLFIPKDVSVKNVTAIRWSYFGLFITYTFSGLWKVIGLSYKFFITGEEMNWFHPEAALRNAVSGHIDSGVSFERVAFLFEYPWVWQVLFPIMMCLQIFNFSGAFNPSLRPWIVIGNISFHVVNSIVFLISFWFTPILLVVAFFPYHRLRSSS